MKTLICLLLLSSVCFADEPDIVDYGITFQASDFMTSLRESSSLIAYDKNHEVLRIEGIDYQKGIIEDKFKVQISCPDGYDLQAMLKDGRFNKRCLDKHVVCLPEGHYTEAELKCVKAN